MKPAQEAEATVQAYLAHLRSRSMIRVIGLAIISSLIIALIFLVSHLPEIWFESIMP